MNDPINHRLTWFDLLKACRKYKYIACRMEYYNKLIGYNCAIAFTKYAMHARINHRNQRSPFISFKPITFQEYISCKSVFVS